MIRHSKKILFQLRLFAIQLFIRNKLRFINLINFIKKTLAYLTCLFCHNQNLKFKHKEEWESRSLREIPETNWWPTPSGCLANQNIYLVYEWASGIIKAH